MSDTIPLDALPFDAALLDDRGAVLSTNSGFADRGATPGGSFFDALGDADDVCEARERFRDGMLRGKLDDAVLVTLDGDEPIRLQMRSLPVGADAFALVVATPVPGERTLEQRLDALEARLAAIGPIKHSIGSPLMGIVGYADLLRQSVQDGEQRRQADAIVEQCKRVEEQLDRLDDLRFGR